MRKKIKIICTLGPSSLNANFLEYSQKNIDLLRLNMSHLNLNEMQKNILFIRKYTNTQICIDSEGAQIRSKVKKKKFFKKNLKITVFHGKANFLEFYPEYIFNKIKKGDLLNIGFDNLFDELNLRWKWLNENKRLDKLRINQDINWLYSCISKDFGNKGLERIKKNVSYKNSPFSKLKELKSKFNF